MRTAKLSKKHQIVIPKEVREKLLLKPGSRVEIYPIDQYQAMIWKQPTNYTKAMRGLGKEVWKALGGTDKYIEGERASWGNR